MRPVLSPFGRASVLSHSCRRAIGAVLPSSVARAASGADPSTSFLHISALFRAGFPTPETFLLCVAPTNNLAQDAIGERRCHRLAARQPDTLKYNGLKFRQAITLPGAVDVLRGKAARAVLRFRANQIPAGIAKLIVK